MDPSTQYNFYNIDDLSTALEAGQVVLTPNHRLARRIKLAWAQRQSASGHSSWQTPRVMSLQQWWLDCYEADSLRGLDLPVLATQQQELELWQACITGHPGSEGLLRPRGAAQLARDAWHNLCLWQLNWRDEATAQQFRFDPDAAQFIAWAELFEQGLERSGLEVIPRLAPRLAQNNPSGPLVLAEFDELPPLYRKLLESQAQELTEYRSRERSAACKIVACDGAREELLQAGHWAFDLHSAEPSARIGILVPGLQHQRHTVERVLRDAFTTPEEAPPAFERVELPVNFSAGFSLATCSPVRSALGLLELALGDIHLPALVSLLHSRYRDQSELAAEQDLIRRLYRRGREIVGASRLRYECSRIEVGEGEGLRLGSRLQKLNKRRELRRRHRPSAWRSLFSDCLAELGWPGPGPLDSVEYQQLEHWYRALESLAELDQVCEALDFREALQRLQYLCLSAVFQAQTVDAPIQVLGLLEAAGLEFDYLWLCGMSSGEWPPAASPNPFIPDRLQKKLSMPHASAARELQYARGLLNHYRASTGTLLASYARMQDDVPRQASPLLDDIEASPDPETRQPHAENWIIIRDGAPTELVEDEHAPALDAEELSEVRGGSGLIADQSQCPFRAFAHHRLGARPLPELGIALSSAERGALLHDALFHLWGDLQGSQQLHALAAGQRQQRVDQAATAAVDGIRGRHSQALDQALLDIELLRLKNLLAEWLEIEAERDEFEVLARERDCEVQIGALHLNLRIDRIDRLANGRQLLMDYKSGRSEIRHWLGERPEAPQLPLYAEAIGEDLDGITFAVINKRHREFRGIGQSAATPGIQTEIEKLTRDGLEPIADWEELRRSWQQVLQRLAQEFLDGHSPVDPIDPRNTCNYCGLESLCRIR